MPQIQIRLCTDECKSKAMHSALPPNVGWICIYCIVDRYELGRCSSNMGPKQLYNTGMSMGEQWLVQIHTRNVHVSDNREHTANLSIELWYLQLIFFLYKEIIYSEGRSLGFCK